ncbi:MAG: DMT family transporter [Desulfovibrionaceae bacterium]
MTTATGIASGLDTRSKGILAALFGTMLISFDSIFIRLSGAGGFDTIFLFGLFTTISMATLIQARDPRGLVGTIREGGWPIFFSGLIMLGSASTFVMSVQHTAVANTVIIMSSQPVFTAVLSWLFLRERSSWQAWLAMGAVMAGMAVVVSGGIGAGNVLGDGLAVCTMLFLAVNGTLQRRYLQVSRMAIVGAGGLFLTLAMVFVAEPGGFTLRTWLVMAAMGLFSAPLGRVLKATSTRHITATEMSLISLSLAVFAPLWAFLVFGERPPLNTLLGGCIILVALALYFASTRNRG